MAKNTFNKDVYLQMLQQKLGGATGFQALGHGESALDKVRDKIKQTMPRMKPGR